MINIKIQKIALITCWYGYYPWYFPYFIHTCSYNPAIDFILITENKEEIPNRPKNVIIINKSIEEINTSFTDKLGFTVRIENPYKLCDFKPAYGYLFSELINDYDFWGHIDLDIIFGDIREFITEDMLLNYEVISCRHDYTAGYFTLFKNNMKCNMLFKTSRDYIKVFTNAENYWFDECGSLTSKINMEDEVLDIKHLLNNLDEFKKNYLELFESFKKFGFIKDSNFDELEFILFQNRKIVFDNEQYHLTINPTLQCNYKCWYCCVEDQGTVYRKERMNDETIEKLKMHIKYMIEKEHISSLLLDWFGGEPLMYFYEVIYPLCLYAKSLCITHGVQLTNHITTNAYFIDHQMLIAFKEINVSSFQIPIDGGRKKHNSIKNHNGLGHFDKIMNNINSICEYIDDVNVVVRINYDKQSLKTISSIMQEIKKENKEKIIVDFQRVWQVEFNRDMNGDNIQLLKVKREFEEAGFKTVYFAYKQKKFTCCYSDRFFHRVINYDGKVFKCSARNYDDDLCIAVLNDDGTMCFNNNLISKMFSDSTFRNDQCLECNMLPLCYGPCIQKYYETKVGESLFHCLQKDSEISFRTYIQERIAKINI